MKGSLFLQKILIIFCVALFLFCSCKSKPRGPEAPPLIRLVDLMQDPGTEIDSHIPLEKEDIQPLKQHGWDVGETLVTAKEKHVAFVLPKWLWKSRDFRMRFKARSEEPRELMVQVQGKEIARYHLAPEWKEYFIQYRSRDLKKPTVKQIQFMFGGDPAGSYAEFQSFQLPLYSWGRTRIAREVREALSVNSTSKVRFHLRLPSKSPMLFFGVGVPVEKGAASEAVFKVLIESKKGNSELIRKTVEFPQPYPVWKDVNIDLRKHAGEEIVLEFQVESTLPRRHYVAWSSPEIYELDAKRTKPNIIFVSIDTMRADRLSDRTSPNLMKLARESQVFTNAYCTFPSTLPSHASVMTGLYVANHQVSRPVESIARVKQIPNKLPTIAEVAQRANYFTAGITDGGFVSSFFGFDRGFHQYSENIRETRRDVATISNAIRWLNQNSQRPFFLFLHSYEVHEPFNPPSHVFQKLFPNPAMDRPPIIPMELLHGVAGGTVVPTEQQKEFIQQCYDAEVYFFDQNFGRLMHELKRLSLDQNTVILVFSDHGELFFEDDDHSLGHGKTLAMNEIKVPLILHRPGGNAAQRDDLVSLVDIYPTLMEIMGATVETQLDGISLLEPSDSKKRFNRSIYFEVMYGKEAMWGVQTREFKMLLDKEKGAEYFYDLRKDPNQKLNVSHTNTRSLQRMKQLLAAYVQKSTFLTEWAQSKQDMQETEDLKKQLKALGYIN